MADERAALLEERAIRLDGAAGSAEQAIRQTGQLLVEVGAVTTSYVDSMLEREQSVSTVMGEGVAIPHGTNESKGAVKRGNAGQAVPLDDAMLVCEQRAEELIAIDDALSRLAELDPEQAHLVELRFFGGLSFEEASEVLGLSLATVKWCGTMMGMLRRKN